MSDGVKFIFKTLIRIPVIIMVCYAVFNVFTFGTSYFRMLGLSYVAMQTAVENNYIPSEEETALTEYMNSIESEILTNVQFTDDTDLGETARKRYGDTVTVGVTGHYRFVWPLQPKEQHVGNAGVDGMNHAGRYAGDKTDAELEAAREAYDNAENNITIRYRVPGLKYYADQGN